MKLSEKILYSRKRAGLSQEALAAKLGVSRRVASGGEQVGDRRFTQLKTRSPRFLICKLND